MRQKATAPTQPPGHNAAACAGVLLSFRDAMDTIGGKWKSPILLSLGFKGTMRFGELQRMHQGIPAKTLSKELKDLEQNGLVKRTVLDTMPVTVEYEITPYGRTLEKLLLELRTWGVSHREYIRTGNVPKKTAKRVAKSGKLEVVG
ncbi:MAG TPA: helix-turn-helix domain-containing protein [Flavobacteriales bacterium]|jgi:DNA-binding HxlR family transcriptional regulator|nr:helix-turn-helix domain-containing protein [Flavobacteriales bacterium]